MIKKIFSESESGCVRTLVSVFWRNFFKYSRRYPPNAYFLKILTTKKGYLDEYLMKILKTPFRPALTHPDLDSETKISEKRSPISLLRDAYF